MENIEGILKYSPFHLELGSGPSLELGIPSLYDLHKLFSVSYPKSKKIIFGDEKDTLILNFLKNPNDFIKQVSKPILKSIECKEKEFHQVLRKGFESKYFVGEIITNNFDGVNLRGGLKEKFVRRFEETKILPKIKFVFIAKSLLVIGSHADRRFVQQAARAHGLKVIFVDPEGFKSGKGF